MKNLRYSKLICICVLVLLVFPAASRALAPQAGTPAPGADGITSLSSAAQGVISATLGADDPAYHFDPVLFTEEGEKVWQTTHPRHGFDADLSAEGAVIGTGAHRLKLSLSGYGCGKDLRLPGMAVVQANANRLDYVRDEVTEWYVNGPLGLEHGFTITQPCKELESPAGSLLTLRLAFEGNLYPAVDEDEAGLTFTNSSGTAVLRYSGLTAWDSDGKELPARLELLPTEQIGNNKKEVAIRIETRGARYPITIDPWIQNAKLTASDSAAGDLFGYSVAVNADTVVVGALNDDDRMGSAYVFVKPDDIWSSATQTARLTSETRNKDDEFGISVAVSGDTVVVGADGVNGGKGVVYMFVKPVSGWSDMTETFKMNASVAAAGDYFGYSVAFNGDTLVAGAIGDDTFTGSAYVFVKPTGGWKTMYESAKLTAPTPSENTYFGQSVAVSGETVVVGAPFEDKAKGSAYVFIRPPGGWSNTTQAAILTSADRSEWEFFGTSVAIEGDVVVVGAPGTSSLTGSAYVYEKPVGGWHDMTETAEMTASDHAEGDGLGISVAINRNTLVAGAYGDDSYVGSAYVFVKPSGGWSDGTEAEKLTAADGVADDMFGNSVAINGGTIVAGMYGEDAYTGSVYVFVSDISYLFLPLITR